MKRTKLTPKQVLAYEKQAGFKTTGDVFIVSVDDEVQKLYESLLLPKP